MSDPNYQSFQNVCKNLDQNTICSFKNSRDIIGIIENVNLKFGNDYLNNIMKFQESQKIDWNRIKH